VYLNGSLYTVVQAKAITSMSSGDFYLGNPSVSGQPFSSDVRGFLSKVKFMNYMPSREEVDSLYEQGPSGSGLLSAMGISTDYRVRSPIYRLGEEEEEDS
jgi:hypothetical protein